MQLYKKFVTRDRDDFATLDDLKLNYKINVNENFNFAYDCLDVIAQETPDALALLWVGNDQKEKRFTFSEIAVLSNKCASYLSYMGIKQGDRVMLVMTRDWRYWYTIMALHRIGAVAVPVLSQLTAKDMIYRLNSAEISSIIATPKFGVTKIIDSCLPECPSVINKFVFGKSDGFAVPYSWMDFDSGVSRASKDFVRPQPFNKNNDMMLMMFSSGTTGFPKIVWHDFTYPLGHIFTGCFWHRCKDGGLHFTISDTGWAKSLWGKLYGQWLAGCAVFTYDFEKFNANDILSKLEKYRITSFCAPPTMYRYIIREDLSKCDLSALEHCTTAGEALNPEVYNVWLKGTGRKIFEGFGQSETTLCCCTPFPWVQPRLGSMGLPVPGYRIAVIDENGKEAAVGATGEICIRTDKEGGGKPFGLFNGYLDEEKTKEVWYDGLYHTGDTAYRDEMGFIWYVGRTDDIIKSSGYRIGPFEVESALMEHPSVVESAVTGVPDAIRGFAVKASVVLAPGYEGTEELTKELQEHVKKVTAPYKYPRIIQYVESLPKTVSGKIRRVEIRQKDEIQGKR